MKRNLLTLFALAVVLFVMAGPVFAHHSMMMYDRNQTAELKATVIAFNWENPHITVHFDVKDASGNVTRWVAEGPSPVRLNRTGWSKDTMKPGDQVTIYGNPNKDGSPTMRLVKVGLPSGQEIVAFNGNFR